MNTSLSHRLLALALAALWGAVELVALWRSRFTGPATRR